MGNNLGINLQPYTNDQALFDTTTQESLSELNKALEAGELTGRETVNRADLGGMALKVESLEKNLKVLQFKESDIRLWKRIPKMPAYNTVEEFNQLTSYGADRGGFNNEGELPVEEDSTYVRRSQLVKFLGVTKAVSHPMQLVNVHISDIIQKEIQNGILWILRKANKGLFYADSNIIPQEFNGLYAQHKANDAFASMEDYFSSELVIDMRGYRLNENVIEQGSEAIIRNYGYANTLMAPPVVLSDFVKSFHEQKMIQPVAPQISSGIAGQKFEKFQSQFGVIDLDFDLFALKGAPRKITDATQTVNAPGDIIPDVATPLALAADGLNKWTGFTGDYFYAVAAVNRYGEGKLVLMNASSALFTVTATNSVALKFTAGSGNPATGFVVYRSEKNPTGTAAQTNFYPLFQVSTSELSNGYDGGGNGLVWDRNRILPNTQEAFIYQDDSDVYSFKQLAPIMKMDLAILGPSTRFMVLMYGTPVLYAPKKMVRYINIGRNTPA